MENGTFKGTIGSNLRKSQIALNAFNQEYSQAKGRANAHEAQLTQLSQMEKRIADFRTSIAKARREMNGLGKPEEQYLEVQRHGIERKQASTGAACLPPWPRYSISLSAIAVSVGGTSMPSCLAVRRLITRSNFVTWITGIAAGFSPLRMRPIRRPT
jgi:hypothetical protein